MFKKTQPLLVVVTETRYDMYGTSIRQKALAKLLKSVGGINHTVAPGSYDYNVHRKGLTMYMTLDPHQA